MKALKTDKAPAAIGPYSQAIEVNGFVFASGQIPLNPATGEFVEGGIKEQTRQALNNAREILRSAGLDLSNVVKTSVMLADIKYFGEMNEVYAEFFIRLDHQDVLPRACELQLQVEILHYGHRTCRRCFQLRFQQQMGILPFSSIEMEHQEGKLPEISGLAGRTFAPCKCRPYRQ